MEEVKFELFFLVPLEVMGDELISLVLLWF